MRKIITFLISFTVFFISFHKTFSYGVDFDGTNFYTTMSNSISELNEKIYSKDLPGQHGTKERIKRLSKIDCLTEDLTEGEIKAIVLGRNEYLIAKIKEDCKNEEGNIGQNILFKLNNAVLELDTITRKDAVEKTEYLLSMSEIGVYADGLEHNSPFDLIKDLEDIDKIIFEKEFDYEGDKKVDLNEKLDVEPEEPLESTRKDTPIEPSSNHVDINNSSNFNKKNKKSNSSKIISKYSNNEKNELLCSKLGNCEKNISSNYKIIRNKNICNTKNNSGLSGNIEKILELTINKKNSNSSNTHKNEKNNSKNKKLVDKKIKKSKINENSIETKTENSVDTKKESSEIEIAEIEVEDPESEYEKADDWKLFPCKKTFCIDINFNTYNHNLLGGWSGNKPSIEFIINRSNEHLKKFINSPLTQRKMTINHGEANYKDINFAKIFHMRIIIRWEPIPILELENEKEKKEETKPEYNLDNILEELYKAHGLDYSQPNDLTNLLSLSEEKNAVLNSSYTTITTYGVQKKEMTGFKNSKKSKILEIENVLEKEARNSAIESLVERFKEISHFANNINNYISNLDAVLKEIKEIPVDTGKV